MDQIQAPQSCAGRNLAVPRRSPPPPTFSSLPAGARGQSLQAPHPAPPNTVQTSTAYPRHHWTVRRISGADWLASPSVRTKALITRPRASRGRARVRARRGLRLQVKRQFSGLSMGVLGGISGRTGKGYCASCPSAGSVPCDGVALMSFGWDPSLTGSPRWEASRVGDSTREMALLPPLGAKWGACSPCSAPTDSGTFPASLLESLGTWFQSLILDLGVGGDTETTLGGGTDGPREGRQWVADGTARRRFLQETALSVRGCLGVCVCVCWGGGGYLEGEVSPSPTIISLHAHVRGLRIQLQL